MGHHNSKEGAENPSDIPSDTHPNETVPESTGEPISMHTSGSKSQNKGTDQDTIIASRTGKMRQVTRQKREEDEPLKTGGIVISKEDTLPSKQDEVHENPDGTSTAQLKPGKQLQRERESTAHSDTLDTEPMSRSSVDEGAQEPQGKIKDVSEAVKHMEFEPVSRLHEESIRTGGIVINQEDTLPSKRQELREAPDGTTYLQLKPGTQLEKERASVPSDSKEAGPLSRLSIGEFKNAVSEVRDFMDVEKPESSEEPLKTGGIIIDKEDVLPSMQDEIREAVDGSTYMQLKPGSQLQEEREGEKEHMHDVPAQGSLIEEDLMPKIDEVLQRTRAMLDRAGITDAAFGDSRPRVNESQETVGVDQLSLNAPGAA